MKLINKAKYYLERILNRKFRQAKMYDDWLFGDYEFTDEELRKL
tara:strand:+ start:1896 stop:2027 length:132 start_codon:yes stop_codon:yes gene_type:complete